MAEFLDDKTRNFVSAALLAYNAMETTKRRHFDYMTLLEAKKKKFNLSATEEEQELLATLLVDHDLAVKNFKLQSQSLLLSEPEAHRSLFNYIGVLNAALGDVASGTSH